MDIAKTIKDASDKISKDPKILEKFQKDPVKTVESVVGVDLPDDTINKIIDAVKAKIKVEKAAKSLASVAQKLSK